MATELEKAKEIENTEPEQAMELFSSIGKHINNLIIVFGYF